MSPVPMPHLEPMPAGEVDIASPTGSKKKGAGLITEMLKVKKGTATPGPLALWVAKFPDEWKRAMPDRRVCPYCRAVVLELDVSDHAAYHVAMGDLDRLPTLLTMRDQVRAEMAAGSGPTWPADQ